MLNQHIHHQQLSEELADSIAIIGMAGRFPKAADLNAFWQLLCAGQSGMTVHPYTAQEQASLPDNWVPVTLNLDDAADFDAALFQMTPREAAMIDPQQRCFLEICYTALEHAGYAPRQTTGKVGVFAGVSPSQYFMEHVIHHVDSHNAMSLFTGSLPDQLATRVAWQLNLRGPAMTVATACSTSLAAVSVAVQYLESYQCDMALVGGSSLQLGDEKGYQYIEGSIFSADGICRPFDEQASGTLTGSGVAAVVLKRTQDALADGDNIIALIRSTALNNDGNHKVGYTAPSETGQAELVIEAMTAAALPVDKVKYVEAHGTATKIGDPIELKALSRAYESLGAAAQQTYIGSLKTNFGHLDAAAGITGLMKAALVLKHRVVPPMPYFERPNSAFALAQSPFMINREPVQLAAEPEMYAAVSSFGIGGTNAHAVLQNWPVHPNATAACLPFSFLPFSAQSRYSLQTYAQKLQDEQATRGQFNRDCIKTLVHGRERYPLRSALLLQHGVPSGQLNAVTALEQPKVAFIFPGQGTQFSGMARQLYQTEPVYRRQFDQLAQLALTAGINLPQIINGDAAQLARTCYTQPALFAVEYSLAVLLAHYGVQSTACLGHSVGEWVAAALSGLLSVNDAFNAVIERARLMDKMPAGAMLSVAKPWDAIADLLPPGVELAVVNSHQTAVLAGSLAAIAEAELILTEEGLSPKRFQTSHAYHSEAMTPMLAEFAQYLTTLRFRTPERRWISNLNGDWICPQQVQTPDYWCRHVRHTVQFAAGLDKLMAEQYICLEVGPGQTFTQQLIRQQYNYACATIGSAKQCGSESALFWRMFAQLWTFGVEPDWDQVLGAGPFQRQVLPTYPFDRKTHWWGTRQTTQSVTTVTPQLDEPATQVGTEPLLDTVLAVFRQYFGRDDIAAQDDYFSLGGDSLLVVSLLKELNQRLGRQLTLDQFLQAASPQKLSVLLSQPAPAQPADLTDVLAADLQPCNEGAQPQAALVTGCTGFWGIHLLQELYQQTEQQLYCLVRAEDEASARQRLYRAARQYGLSLPTSSHRLQIVLGDISQPRFGLNTTQFAGLAAQVGRIYHLAASVNHFYSVSALRACNIDSVVTCLQLAAMGPAKRLVFASSISVYSNTAYREYDQVAETPALLAGTFSSGYGQSKWLAEQLLWQAQARGFDIVVLRAGNITGSTAHGLCNEKDAIWALLKGCVQTQAYPRSAADLYVDMLPVDQASTICRILAETASAGSVYHLVPHNLMTFRHLLAAAQQLGYQFESLEDPLWANQVRAKLTDEQQRPLYRMLQAPEAEVEVNKQLRFTNATLCGLLNGQGVALPEITELTVRRYLETLLQRGFLPAPAPAPALID